MTLILNRLDIAIEQQNGHEILSKVYSSRHAAEQYGLTLTHILDAKDVDKLTKEIDNDKPIIIKAANISYWGQCNFISYSVIYETKRVYCPSTDMCGRYKIPPIHSSMHRYYDEYISEDKSVDNGNCRNISTTTKLQEIQANTINFEIQFVCEFTAKSFRKLTGTYLIKKLWI